MRSRLGASKMLKTVCLAFCLLSLSAAFALRPSGTAKIALNLASAAGEPDETPAVNAASKADRLPIAHYSDQTRQATIQTTPVAPVQVEAATEPPKKQITSWHWHAGSNKITRK